MYSACFLNDKRKRNGKEPNLAQYFAIGYFPPLILWKRNNIWTNIEVHSAHTSTKSSRNATYVFIISLDDVYIQNSAKKTPFLPSTFQKYKRCQFWLLYSIHDYLDHMAEIVWAYWIHWIINQNFQHDNESSTNLLIFDQWLPVLTISCWTF